eukprot:scaffold510_cov184-Skeletonema_menzelii.AAC.15
MNSAASLRNIPIHLGRCCDAVMYLKGTTFSVFYAWYLLSTTFSVFSSSNLDPLASEERKKEEKTSRSGVAKRLSSPFNPFTYTLPSNAPHRPRATF